ncbi:hypothetical protein RSM1_11480 [Methylobacterium radiotolerans]|nr:hypothetical protein RSM1_11480 [Methylobacterium radiotolerans]OXE43093.1 hypothetical protein CCS92_04770 [Methylobacterium radiotolerans]
MYQAKFVKKFRTGVFQGGKTIQQLLQQFFGKIEAVPHASESSNPLSLLSDAPLSCLDMSAHRPQPCQRPIELALEGAL